MSSIVWYVQCRVGWGHFSWDLIRDPWGFLSAGLSFYSYQRILDLILIKTFLLLFFFLVRSVNVIHEICTLVIFLKFSISGCILYISYPTVEGVYTCNTQVHSKHNNLTVYMYLKIIQFLQL